jgi:hypothetical protein
MAIEFDIRIIGDTPLDVIRALGELSARVAGGLGVGEQQADSTDATPPAATDGNGAGKPASTRKRGPKAEPEASKIDRAAIIDGLTKIYSKGDEDVRLAITKFRDGQGVDRLRDLKDDALPAAAELLVELKLATDPPPV